MKVFIVVPTFESIYPETFKSIYGLDKCGHWCVFDFVRGYDVATARNRIAQQAINEKADYVLMVDNDVVLPSDALANLISHNEDVVLGFYAHRDTDNTYRGNTCICKLKAPDGTEYYNYPRESEYTAAELETLGALGATLIRIHGGGKGCALIRTSVFERIEKPWFKWVTYDDGGTLSEDLHFDERCKAAGIPVYADPRVLCGHVFRKVQEVS